MVDKQLAWEREHLTKLQELLVRAGNHPVSEEINKSITYTEKQISKYESLKLEQNTQENQNNG